MGNPDSNYYSCRKEQISFIVLCEQTLYLYFQTAEGLLTTVIGVDLSDIDPDHKTKLFSQPIFANMEGLTMIPSIAMALLTSHLVIFWLLNVLFLICVPASVPRLSKKKGKVSV
jgi:hypothetical protein